MVVTKSCLFVSGRTRASRPSFEIVSLANPDHGSSEVFATAQRGKGPAAREKPSIADQRRRLAASHFALVSVAPALYPYHQRRIPSPLVLVLLRESQIHFRKAVPADRIAVLDSVLMSLPNLPADL